MEIQYEEPRAALQGNNLGQLWDVLKVQLTHHLARIQRVNSALVHAVDAYPFKTTVRANRAYLSKFYEIAYGYPLQVDVDVHDDRGDLVYSERFYLYVRPPEPAVSVYASMFLWSGQIRDYGPVAETTALLARTIRRSLEA